MTGVSSDLWTIAYDGTKLDFLKNGTVFHTRAAAANLGLVVKHRAYTQGAVMRDLSFGPLPDLRRDRLSDRRQHRHQDGNLGVGKPSPTATRR